MARRFVITGGGTGGHVTPALALGEAIVDRGDEVLFVGSRRGLESRLVPDAGFELRVLPSEQVMGRNLAGRLRGALSILRSVGSALRILWQYQPDAVISVGGYAAMPTALAAWLLRRPLFLVEPNAIPGRVNRLTARFARCVFVGFESARGFLPRKTESLCLGVPLRRALYRAFAAREPARVPSKPFHVFVFGGSQGARQLNENVPEALARLAKGSIEVFHQTGEADRSAVAARYAELGIEATVVAFEREMPKRYAWADLAICRAGALTVAELACAGVASILVPFPHAVDDHQTGNAKFLSARGAAILLPQTELSAPRLADLLRGLTRERLLAMAQRAREAARPDASARVADVCEAIAKT